MYYHLEENNEETIKVVFWIAGLSNMINKKEGHLMIWKEKVGESMLSRKKRHWSSFYDKYSTNFYTNEMNKLLNKCPLNGDEPCNCKKCQCVLRNS